MIYLRNKFVEIHIRTLDRGRYSDIVAVALQIGSDIVEITENAYYINSVSPLQPPKTIGSNYSIEISPSRLLISLSGGQFISIYGGTVRISAHGSDFYDSNGMTGKWNLNGFIGRDGMTKFDNMTEFAIEWEVSVSKGDPLLFRSNATNRCGEVVPPQPPDTSLIETAERVCTNISSTENRKECIFDVVTTGDVSFAQSEVYVNPLEIENRCEAMSSDCEFRGGKCVWRCDGETNDCLPGLCSLTAAMESYPAVSGETRRSEMVVDGCSCAVPKPSDIEFIAVSASPTGAPTKAPTKSSPTGAPTIAPTKSPTKNPSAVSQRPCGLFRLGIFCPFTFCGLIGRLLNICQS